MGSFGAGPATINVGLFNEIGGNDKETNSYLVQAAGSLMNDNLKLNLAWLSQSDNTALNPQSIGDVVDFYATYGMDTWFVNFELLDGSTSVDGLPDMAYGLTGHMDFGSGMGATLRYENVSYNDVGSTSVDDSSTITLAFLYAVTDNLSLNAEYNSVDVGGTTDKADEFLLEALATFGN